MNIPRLTTDDVPLFSGVITDLFPLDQAPKFDYGVLLKAIEGELARHGYQVSILYCIHTPNTQSIQLPNFTK